MFFMAKSRVLDEVQFEDGDVHKRHYGEDVKFYQKKNTGKYSKDDPFDISLPL